MSLANGAQCIFEAADNNDLVNEFVVRPAHLLERIKHSVKGLLTQRIFQVACGYEDANASNTLRHDPMFKLGAGQRPLDAGQNLAHASTFTRLGQSLSRTNSYRMAQAFLEYFVASYAAPPEVIMLDLDHTDHWVYGQQELALFNTYYGDACHLPLLIFEDLSGRLISALLQPGKSPTGRENAAILKRVLAGLRQHWPDTHIVVRGDMGFAQPALMRKVQADPHADFFYACAAYELMHALRINTLKGTALERAQPATLRHKLFKLAVCVVQYTDRIKLHLPTACPVAGLLARVTEIFYRTPRLKPG